MRTLRAVVTLAALAVPAAAQTTTPLHPGSGGSPHVRSEWVVDGATISIEYGRPSLKGRAIAKLAPAGRVWRTGADEATTFESSKALRFGAVAVPPGKYTLYTVPGDTEWLLVINRQTGQYGNEYDEKQDLGRIPMKVGKTTAAVEQLTLAIEDIKAGGMLRVEWGDLTASVPFAVGK